MDQLDVVVVGDVATPMQQISGAVASGAVAGAMLNHALIADDYARATSARDRPAA